MKRFGAFAVLSLFLSVSLYGDSVAAHWLKPNVQPRVYPEPMLRAAHDEDVVLSSLPRIADHDLRAMREWNAAGRQPMKVGIERRLANPIVVGDGTFTSSNEPFRWRGTLRAEGGSRLRAKLTNVQAAADAVFWVYGSSGEATGFDISLAYDGTLWTPTVEGDTITVELQSPARTPVSFTIVALSDIRDSAEVNPNATDCIKDIGCFTGLEQLQTTVALMYYQRGSDALTCSGGLIGDTENSGTPFFITANHCIANSAEAASLETFWDYKTTSCNGADPGLGGSRRVSGSTLISTTTTQDLTLLRLPGVPGGTRFFLGWTSTRPPVGATLYRVSHPGEQPQRFSTAVIEATSNECIDTSRANFIYSKPATGTVIGGSSGSPTLNEQAQVVGALNGGCPGSADPCGGSIRITDGAFSTAYNTYFQRHLNPGAPITPGCSTCVPNANTACMLNGRFKVTLTWSDPSANLSGNGRIITYAENKPITSPPNGEVSQVSFWSMYPNDTTSVEALVRMIRGGSSFWIFTTGFAAAEYTVTVQDTQKCTTWQRTSPFGSTNKIADYNALPF